MFVDMPPAIVIIAEEDCERGSRTCFPEDRVGFVTMDMRQFYPATDGDREEFPGSRRGSSADRGSGRDVA
jgi:hypothetical protein